MTEPSSLFGVFGLTRKMIMDVSKDPAKGRTFLTAYRNQWARCLLHSDQNETDDALLKQVNVTLDKLEQLSPEEFTSAARAYAQGGTDDELYGPKLELQKAGTRIRDLEEILAARDRHIALLGTERDRKAELIQEGTAKILRAASGPILDLAEGLFSPAMLEGYTLFGERIRSLHYKTLSPREQKRLKRTKLVLTDCLKQPVARVRGGHLEVTVVEVVYPKPILLEEARDKLIAKVDSLLARPGASKWEDRGLFIGICTFSASPPRYDNPEMIPRRPVTAEELALFASGSYFMVAQNVLRPSEGSVATDYLISIMSANKRFSVNAFEVKTRAFRRPIAPQ